MENTLDTPKTHNLPTPTLKLESPTKLLFDCLILILVGFVGYQVGLKSGGAPQTLLIQGKDQQIQGKDQQIQEKNRKIQDQGGQIDDLKMKLAAYEASQLKAYRDTGTDLKSTSAFRNKLKPVPMVELKLDGGKKPGNDPRPNGLPPLISLDTPKAPSSPIKPASNDDRDRLLRSLQEEASGNPRVDALIEADLESKLSDLQGRHNSVIKLWSDLSAKHAAKKLESGRVLEHIFLTKKNEREKYTQEESRNLLETLNNRNASLMKEAGDLSAEILRHDGILANSTNQIVEMENVLKDFKASRLEFETGQTASQNRIKANQVAEQEKLTDALVQISSLNSVADSLRNKIEALSDGYSLHTTLSSNNWKTAVFEEAKEHAARIPNKSKSLLDESQRKANEFKEKREEKDINIKAAESLLKSIATLEEKGLLNEEKAEAEKEEIQTTIDELNADIETLTTAQEKNSGDLTELETAHKKAVKEQENILAKIELNQKGLEELSSNLERLLTIPVKLESSPTSITAIELEFSKTTNNISNVDILITSSSKKLEENTAKLTDLKRKKVGLEKSVFGGDTGTKQQAAIQELGTLLPQMNELDDEIKKINLLLKAKNEERSKLVHLKDHLEGSMAILNPKPLPEPDFSDEIVLVPQGKNVLQCAFIVRQVPSKEKKSRFGKATEYDKFLEFHNKQVAHLQSTMRTVRVFSELKAGSGATDSEKYDDQILKYLANSLIESTQTSQTSGTSEAILKTTDLGLSGTLIVYGYSQSESGTMQVYVQEIASEPNQVTLKPGKGELFSFTNKK